MLLLFHYYLTGKNVATVIQSLQTRKSCDLCQRGPSSSNSEKMNRISRFSLHLFVTSDHFSYVTDGTEMSALISEALILLIYFISLISSIIQHYVMPYCLLRGNSSSLTSKTGTEETTHTNVLDNLQQNNWSQRANSANMSSVDRNKPTARK